MTSDPDALIDLTREALRVSESRYRRLFETAQNGILLLNADTAQIEDVNPYLIEMLGYSHAEFLGKKLWEVGPFADIAQSKEMFAELQTKGYIRYEDLPLKTKAGAQIEVEFVSNTYDCEGIKVIQCNMRDITERKKAEKELRAKELHYHAVTTSATDAFVTSDAAGHISGWNPSAERIFGYAETEVIGQPLTLLIPERFQDRHLDGMKRRQSGGERRVIGKTVELVGRRKDANEFPLELSLAEWTDGESQFFTGIIRDLTERKAADAKIERLTQLYAALSQCNEAIVRCASEKELFPKICRAAVQFGGMKMAWIGIIDPDTRMLRPAASFGDHAVEYLQDIEISMDPDSPLGHGPSATAIRENQPVWRQDFQHDTLAVRWYERRMRFAWNASASLPLHRNGVPIGVLTLYAGEVGAFDDAARQLLVEMATDISFALDNFVRESQRKQAEEALARESHRNQVFLRNASDGVHILDADGNVLEVSDSFCEMLGYSREELIGANVSLWDAQWSPQELKQLIAEQIAKEDRTVLETQHRRRDGSILDVEVTGQGLELEGKPVLFNSARDITERIRTQGELRTLSRAVEQSPASIVITDRSGNIEYVNPRFEQVTGYTRAEAVGRNPRILQSGTTSAEIYRDLWKAISEGGEWRGELCNRRKNGELFWEFAALSGLTDESGEVAHYIAVKEDITKRKRAEDERASLEVQLRESQKMEAIGTLAGGIAHDFNNALAIILGNVELARRQDMSASPLALESLEEIRKAGSRARDLVQQILSFSRRQPIERKLTALAPIVEESVRLLRATLPARLALDVHCDTDVPAVLADATQIKQVLINLGTNAMQAMHGGPGRIGIRLDTAMLDAALADAHPALRAMHANRPGRAVRLAVSDDGLGMDAAILRRIFEPFFTTKQVGEGTGLGLSVVHGIVQAHEGAIAVDSQPGKGATFTLYLPTAKMQAGAPETDESAAAAAATPDMGGGQHILYLDDDESLVLLVQRLLEHRGYRISGYIDHGEALDALRADPAGFDLVVTDYNMPGMSGLDVAREVRAIRADLPVAVASGFIDEELRAQAGGAGVRELIFKANAVEDFCEVVQRLVQTVGEPSRA